MYTCLCSGCLERLLPVACFTVFTSSVHYMHYLCVQVIKLQINPITFLICRLSQNYLLHLRNSSRLESKSNLVHVKTTTSSTWLCVGGRVSTPSVSHVPAEEPQLCPGDLPVMVGPGLIGISTWTQPEPGSDSPLSYGHGSS